MECEKMETPAIVRLMELLNPIGFDVPISNVTRERTDESFRFRAQFAEGNLTVLGREDEYVIRGMIDGDAASLAVDVYLFTIVKGACVFSKRHVIEHPLEPSRKRKRT